MTDRGAGWPTVLGLTLVVLVFSVFHPLQLLLIPLAALLLALPPRTPGLVASGAILVALAFSGPQGPLWSIERGWTLLLASWFVLAVVLWPRASFVTRAVGATLATALSAGAILLVAGGWSTLDATITDRYREAVEAMAASWPAVLADAGPLVTLAAEWPARIFPALVGVGSVASLAIAWWAHHRLVPDGQPLGRLPEFRFPDGLVWVMIAGVALLLSPLVGWAPRLGTNLVVFMGALYALRGLAVVIALVGTQIWTLLLLGLFALVLYPLAMAGTLVVGVTDTWLDLRSARRAANDDG